MPAAATEVTGYESLCDTLRELSALQGIDALVGWDEMVMMPQGSAKSRAMQKKVLAGIVHERCTDPKIGEQLKQVEASESSLGEAEAAVVREAKRDYRKATLVTKELAERRAVLQSEGYQAWLQAREQNDWSVFAPKLKELVQVEREVAAAVDPDKSVYDSALDNYEKGFTSARIDDIFAQLKEGVVPLIAELKGGTRPDDAWLQGEWDVKAQAALCDGIVKDLGYDVSHGRLDVSVHPFTCSMHPDDVRMTTRFKPHDVMEGITGAVHECGHALYEQGRNPEYDGLPTSAALSLGVHESQSLLWERMVALTPAFCRYLLPKVQAAFPEFGKGKTAEDLYAAMNTVKEPSYVRVEADEVTYPLHVILRYEIERALLNGELDVGDVPRVWNEKMEGYLGCTPPDHKLGCLQDMHWAMGALGYFTTYTLGAMYAAQIFFTAKKDLPNLEADIEAGKFSQLREWLRERVHKLGSVPPSGDDLMRAVTGEPLNVSIFLDHLRAKYRALYKL